MKLIVQYSLLLIFSILLILGCSVQNKREQELKTNDQTKTGEKDIPSLISNFKIINQKLHSLSEKKSTYEMGDPERKKIEKEYELLNEKGYEILNRLFNIGSPVIPYAREMLKNSDSRLRFFAVLILGEVSKNQEEKEVKEVIGELLEILPSEEREFTINVMGALMKIGKPAIPYIINQLGNEDFYKRSYAFELLQVMTAEKFDYYKPDNTDAQNRQKTIEMIKDWWEKNKANWKMPEYKNN